MKTLKRILKFSILSIILFIIIQITSINFFYIAIFPRKTASYEVLDTNNYYSAFIDMSNNIFPNKIIYKKYYVDDTFFSSFSRWEDSTWYSENWPYKFSLNVYGSSEKYKYLRINNIEIISSAWKKYNQINDTNYPILLEFKKRKVLNSTQDSNWNWKYIEEEIEPWKVYYETPKLNLNFWRKETIILRYDVTLTLSDWTDISKTIEYKYVPILKWWILQALN